MLSIRKNKKLWIFALVPLCLIMLITAKNNSDFVDIYREYFVFSYIARIYSRVIGIIPISLIEIIIYALLIGIIVFIVYFIVNFVKAKEKRIFITRIFTNILVALIIVFTIFELFCGIYYYRKSIVDYLGYETTEANNKELFEVCMELTTQANELVNKVDFERYKDFEYIRNETINAYKNLAKECYVFEEVYGKPKKILMSKAMSYTGIVGIFMPFTMEANVNTDVIDYNIPANACHEMAHMYGFMKEDEANFISYMACVASDDINFKYSGVMLALLHCKNELFYADIELWKIAENALDEKVNQNFFENNEYWKEIEETEIGEKVSEVSNDINDTYLKVNGQEDGVESYTRVVELVIARYKHEKNVKSTLQ